MGTFIVADGKPVEAERGGSSRMSGFGSFTPTWDFELKTGSKDLALEIDFHKDAETWDLPFDITVPAGLD